MMLVLALTLVACGIGLYFLETVPRRSLARGIVRFAGFINRPRQAEFLGELAGIQASPDVTGIDYALGTFIGATVEVATRRKPLRIDNLTKSFGDIDAVQGVSLEVPAGSVTALLGGTGAGKTTLINLLAGVYESDEGTITLGNTSTNSPGIRNSIVVVPRDFGLVDDMTVAENISLAAHRRWVVSPHGENARAADLLAQLGSKIDPRRKANELHQYEKRIVAIARALSTNCELLVMDDPSASLNEDGVRQLFNAINVLRKRRIGLLFVSHRIDEVFMVADRVAVLRDGVLVQDIAIDETTPVEVLSHITGPNDNESDSICKH